MFLFRIISIIIIIIIIIIIDAILVVISVIYNWFYLNIMLNNTHGLILRAPVPKDVIPK